MEMTQTKVELSLMSNRLLVLRPLEDGSEKWTDEVSTHLYIPYSSKEIYKLERSDGITIERGKVITFNNNKYKIQHIKRVDNPNDSGYYLTCFVLTRSFYFLMPILGGNLKSWRYDHEFCNCFIAKEGEESYGEFIYLLYRFNAGKEFMQMESFIENHPLYESKEDPDKYHVLYKFRIPSRYKDDVELILDGKYSRVSVNYKERIDYFHEGKNELLLEILNRSELRRKRMELELDVEIPKTQELASPLDFVKETYSHIYKIDSEQINSSFNE